MRTLAPSFAASARRIVARCWKAATQSALVAASEPANHGSEGAVHLVADAQDHRSVALRDPGIDDAGVVGIVGAGGDRAEERFGLAPAAGIARHRHADHRRDTRADHRRVRPARRRRARIGRPLARILRIVDEGVHQRRASHRGDEAVELRLEFLLVGRAAAVRIVGVGAEGKGRRGGRGGGVAEHRDADGHGDPEPICLVSTPEEWHRDVLLIRHSFPKRCLGHVAPANNRWRLLTGIARTCGYQSSGALRYSRMLRIAMALSAPPNMM